MTETDEKIATIGTLMAQLIDRFPRHADELRVWSGSYKRALAHWSPTDLDDVCQAVLSKWQRNTPPRPGDFASQRPARNAPGRDDATGEQRLSYLDADGKFRCTSAGLKEARRVAYRIVEDALRGVREPLAPFDAYWLTYHYPVAYADPLAGSEAPPVTVPMKDAAFALAQLQVIDGAPRSIAIDDGKAFALLKRRDEHEARGAQGGNVGASLRRTAEDAEILRARRLEQESREREADALHEETP